MHRFLNFQRKKIPGSFRYIKTSIVYAGIGILGINIRIFSGIEPMPKPQKLIEQFCEPANKTTSSRNCLKISCGFGIGSMHQKLATLRKIKGSLERDVSQWDFVSFADMG